MWFGCFLFLFFFSYLREFVLPTKWVFSVKSFKRFRYFHTVEQEVTEAEATISSYSIVHSYQLLSQNRNAMLSCKTVLVLFLAFVSIHCSHFHLIVIYYTFCKIFILISFAILVVILFCFGHFVFFTFTSFMNESRFANFIQTKAKDVFFLFFGEHVYVQLHIRKRGKYRHIQRRIKKKQRVDKSCALVLRVQKVKWK